MLVLWGNVKARVAKRTVTSKDDAKAKVIEAHKILMDMNEANHETFKDLVKVLEDDQLSGG